MDNITDWALAQFQKRYRRKKVTVTSEVTVTSDITKEDIFHYVYAVLHHLAYRARYEINLKREFPRIPFYEDFWKWADWGERLMELHLQEPYHLERADSDIDSRVSKNDKNDTRYSAPVIRLIARKEQGLIEIDTATSLRGVPAEAWEHRLGTYSALEWILERYKEQVIDLLLRVCTVSVDTMKIVRGMPS